MTATDPETGLEQLLAGLEATARQLEESDSQRRDWNTKVAEFGQHLVEGLARRKAWQGGQHTPTGLLALGLPEDPIELSHALELITHEVDGTGLQPASGGHLGYIPGGGIYPGALGDYIAAVTNQYAGVRYAGPGAVAVENLLLRWLRDLLGLPACAHGTLTSGGSIATLVAFVAARDARGLRARDVEHAVVYVTGQAHHCIAKALAIAGLSEAVRREIPVDRRYRMDPAALRATVAQDKVLGLKPFLVVATAGTTDTGAIDPLAEVARIAAEMDLWFHVDAAYGGAFLLVETLRDRLSGIERADSVVVDPHKGFFLPYGTGAVLVRDARHLATSHGHRGAYLQDALDLDGEPSPADLSPELTRHFRGLRFWLPFVLFGVRRFRAALHEKHLLARYFHGKAAAMGLAVGPEPELSVVLFRHVPADGTDANTFNRAMLQKVLEDGHVFLSSTTIEGVFWLRVAVLCFRTHRDRVDHLLEVLAGVVGKAGVISRTPPPCHPPAP